MLNMTRNISLNGLKMNETVQGVDISLLRSFCFGLLLSYKHFIPCMLKVSSFFVIVFLTVFLNVRLVLWIFKEESLT